MKYVISVMIMMLSQPAFAVDIEIEEPPVVTPTDSGGGGDADVGVIALIALVALGVYLASQDDEPNNCGGITDQTYTADKADVMTPPDAC